MQIKVNWSGECPFRTVLDDEFSSCFVKEKLNCPEPMEFPKECPLRADSVTVYTARPGVAMGVTLPDTGKCSVCNGTGRFSEKVPEVIKNAKT